jgi:phosphoribosylformylglycinamidine cyclo-ligase
VQAKGRIADDEMFRTFNMGVGVILAVPEDLGDTVERRLVAAGERAWRIGRVGDGEPAVALV